MKHKIEGTTVTESHVCFVADKEYCLKGGKDSNNNSFYSDNVGVLTEAQPWFTASPQNGGCSINPSGFSSQCWGGVFSHVIAASDGGAGVHYSGSYPCSVTSGGDSGCSGGSSPN